MKLPVWAIAAIVVAAAAGAVVGLSRVPLEQIGAGRSKTNPPPATTPPPTPDTASPPPPVTNLDGNIAGTELFTGRYACKTTLKRMLRDPESLEGDSYVVLEASPDAWKAGIKFRSRNGFGGMTNGLATCSHDGSSYSVQIVSDR